MDIPRMSISKAKSKNTHLPISTFALAHNIGFNDVGSYAILAVPDGDAMDYTATVAAPTTSVSAERRWRTSIDR